MQGSADAVPSFPQRVRRLSLTGILLGLGAALSWGLADYTAALAGRVLGATRVVLGFHLLATALLAVLVLATGSVGSVSAARVPLFVLIGAIGWLSYLAFYGALAIGPISVLSPIVSGYAAVTVLLAVIIGGERPGVGVAIAVLVTMAGVTLASIGGSAPGERARAPGSRRGVVLAVLAVVLLGGFVYGVSYDRERLGWLAPIFLARGFATLFLVAHAVQRRALGWRDPTLPLVGAMVLLAVLDTGGYVFFNLGVRRAAPRWWPRHRRRTRSFWS